MVMVREETHEDISDGSFLLASKLATQLVWWLYLFIRTDDERQQLATRIEQVSGHAIGKPLSSVALSDWLRRASCNTANSTATMFEWSALFVEYLLEFVEEQK